MGEASDSLESQVAFQRYNVLSDRLARGFQDVLRKIDWAEAPVKTDTLVETVLTGMGMAFEGFLRGVEQRSGGVPAELDEEEVSKYFISGVMLGPPSAEEDG